MRGRKLCCSVLVVVFIAATLLVFVEILLLSSYTSYASPVQLKPDSIFLSHRNDSEVLDKPHLCSNPDAFKVVNESCRPCTSFQKNLYPSVCAVSGFIQLISCGSDETQAASCPLTNEAAQRRFWAFELFVIIGAGVSGFIAFKRQRHLEHLAARRMDRRLMAQNEPSQHPGSSMDDVHGHEQNHSDMAPLLGGPISNAVTAL